MELKQNIGLKRNLFDKFYTKKEIVDLCKSKIQKYIKIGKDDLIIEPSAGNGAFIDMIKELGSNYKFYDIEPEHEEIVQQDFLLLDVVPILLEQSSPKLRLEAKLDEKQFTSRIHIIGNPPFGRQSSLVIKFIKKCCKFANTISFILPKSFKKESNKSKFNKFFHLIYQIDLPFNSFLVNDLEHDVPCVFQIWKKKKIPRIIPEKEDPKKFRFVSKNEEHDISFRRVGVYAGKINKDTSNSSIQSHYFIKFLNDNIDENIDKLKNIKFDFNNTVGPKSINKQELIKEFNKYL